MKISSLEVVRRYTTQKDLKYEFDNIKHEGVSKNVVFIEYIRS